MQEPDEQQPLGQVSASQEQLPLVVSHSPFEHDVHAAPPFPHWLGDCAEKATQALPLQQPLGHDVASQTHCPFLHSCPAPHPPQVAPAVPHEPFDWPE